jgi:N utilization substance protein B
MSRRAARIAAVEVLYGADVREADASELMDERNDLDPYAKHLVDEVRARRTQLDEIITRHSLGWTTDRMSSVDRNILRVGVLELIERDVPKAAAIDEAVEIAKRFSGEEAGRFVNGVLAAVMASLYDEGGGSSPNGSSEPGSGGATGGDGGSSAGV